MSELIVMLHSFAHGMKSPAILFFICGIIIGLFKTDLHIPPSISKFLSIYLMIAIGFKGGVAIATIETVTIQMILLFITAILASFFLPFLAYFFIRMTTSIDQKTAAAIAAHYGSVSIVTFLTAEAFLKTGTVTYAPYMIAILAAMEAPAILSGIYLANKENTAPHHKTSFITILKTNGCLLLLICSFAIGVLTGDTGYLKLKGFLDAPFQGILCVFLLDMGLVVADQIEHMQKFTINLFLFGLYMPLLGATCGLLLSYLLGLDVGTTSLFMTLCASASYIAVPAAMRIAIPQASAAIYLPLSLAITFPFNIVIGIPLYYSVAQLLLA